MSSVAVRDLAPGELEQVIALEQAAHPHPWSAALLARELETDCSTILVCTDPEGSGRVAGYVVYWDVLDEVQVLNVAVSPAHRRQGLARRLLEEVEARARARRARLLALEVRSSNQPARALYRAFGYAEAGVRRRYYADGEDAVVMLKELAAP